MRRTAIVLALVFVGLFLVSLPDLLNQAVAWEELSRNAGLAILLTATIALLEPLLERWVNEPTSPLDRFGLVDMKRTRQSIQNEIAERLRNADKVKIISTCLHPFLASHKEQLLENLRGRADRGRTSQVRIVLVDPASDALFERRLIDTLEPVNKDTDKTLSLWVKGIESLQDLARENPAALNVRLSSLAVPASVFLLDDQVYVTPYIVGERGSTAFCYHFTKRGPESVYDVYDVNFERLWRFLEGGHAVASAQTAAV